MKIFPMPRFFLSLMFLLPALGSAEPASLDEATFQRDVVDPMQRSALLTRQALRAAPREDFSPAALVDSGRKTPESVFEWVRDHTVLLPYRGRLRDAQGVQMSRAGNSLDRALLLDTLLAETGVEKRRLVQGRLEKPQAERLYDYWADLQVRGDGDAEVVEASDTEEVLQQVAETTGIDTQTLRRQFEDAQLDYQTMWSEMLDSIEIQAQILPDLLQADLQQSNADTRARQTELLRDHWWVEAEIDGEWVAVDPSRRDHSPGDVLTENVVNREAPEALPTDRLHRLEITVKAEKWDRGKVTEQTVLHHELPVSQLPDRHFRIQLVPARGNPLEAFAGEGSGPAELKKALLSLEEWLPVLKLNGETIIESSILANGDVNESPNAPPAARAMGDAMSALGQLGGGSQPDSELSAVWLELTVHAPGKEPETHVRAFTDVLGPALRQTGAGDWEISESLRHQRALEMLGGVTLMTVTERPSDHWVNVKYFQAWAENASGMTRVLRGAMRGESEEAIGGFKDLRHMPVDLFGIAAARTEALPGEMFAYPDGVNLLARFEVLQQTPGGDSLHLLQVYDWIRHAVDVPPGTEFPSQVRLLQGVVDTHLEDYLTRGGGDADVEGINAASQFTQDLLTGLSWKRITSPQDLAALSDAFTPDQIVRFERAIADGHHLLVRPEPLQVGNINSPFWWTYDPSDGSILGVALDGRGTTAAEYLKVATIIFTTVDALIGVALCTGQEGSAYACCLAEVGGRAALGFGFGAVLQKATALSAVSLYYAGVGFSAVSAATGQLSFCN